MENNKKPIAGMHLMGGLGIEIVEINHVEDIVSYKFSNDDKVYIAHLHYDLDNYDSPGFYHEDDEMTEMYNFSEFTVYYKTNKG